MSPKMSLSIITEPRRDGLACGTSLPLTESSTFRSYPAVPMDTRTLFVTRTSSNRMEESVPGADLDHVIGSKEAAGRPKDIIHLPILIQTAQPRRLQRVERDTAMDIGF